jgi:hypothetical protein
MLGRSSSSLLSWLGLAAAPFALGLAMAAPMAGLAAGAAVGLLAALGWARGESRATVGVAALSGLAALALSHPAFILVVTGLVAIVGVRAAVRSIALARKEIGGHPS